MGSSGQGYGEPIATLPITWLSITAILASLFLGLTAFLMLGSYSRVESVSGVVRYIDGDFRVTAPSSGIVSRVAVVEGQHVRKGDPLLIVDTLRRSVEGNPFDDKLQEGMDHELADLNDRVTAVERQKDIESQSLPQRIGFLKQEKSANEQQEAAARNRLAIASEAYRRSKPVADKGFISGETMRRQQDQIIQLQQSIDDLSLGRLKISEQIATLQSDLKKLPLDLVEERGRLVETINKVRQDRIAIINQRGFLVSSPASGTVGAVQITHGQPIDTQRTVMTISPDNRAPVALADLFVPSRAIGFIEIGQTVSIRYDAFPYQRFGSSSGVVSAISSTSLRPTDIDSAIKLDEPVYRVVVRIKSQYIKAYGRSYIIRSGSGLAANIMLDRRPFISILFDPIMSFKDRF